MENRVSDERLKHIIEYENTTEEEDAIASDLLSTRAQLAALQDKVRWVPVTERLPEEMGGYWCVYINSGIQYVSEVTFSAGAFPCNVTHWMPLPSSPIPAGGE